MALIEPIPILTNDLRLWATKTTNYLKSLEAQGKQPSPKIVQLQHVTKLSTVSAARDGILIWHPTSTGVLVSYNKHWYKLNMTLVL